MEVELKREISLLWPNAFKLRVFLTGVLAMVVESDKGD